MSLLRKQERADTAFWDKHRGIIRTKKGGMVIGEAVYCHGYSMMDDFVGKASFFQVLVLNVTGRLPERRLADWLEALFLGVSYPDARIWCNQIGSLAGTLKASPVAAVSAGILASDYYLYVPGTAVKCAGFMVDALKKKKNGLTVEEIVRSCQRRPGSKPMITGYARPIAHGDERIVAMQRVSLKLGFETGEHLELAYQIEELLIREFDERINLAGYLCAFLCDQGYQTKEIYRLCSAMVNSGVHACYAEAADNPPESFFPLHCNDIDYQGTAPRAVPDRE